MRWFAVGQEPVGVIALGQIPTGVVAIGQGATGVVAVGQLARGVIAVGQLAIGVFAFGQLAVGAAWAGGMLALGGTHGISMLGYGPLGRWIPWRREFEIPVPGGPGRFVLRVLLVAALTAAVLLAVVLPLADALFGSGGVFDRPDPGPTTR
jgi:hypothetical protein